MRSPDARYPVLFFLAALVAAGACGGDSGTEVNPVEVTTTALPPGAPGLPYMEALMASGGDGSSYAWTLASGSGPLPDGVELDANGTLSGIPTAVASSFFTAQVASGGDTDQQALSIDVEVDCYLADCAGLVGMWRMDESPLADSTAVLDGSEQGHVGMLLTGDGATDRSVTGQVGGAVQLDGVDDFVTIQDSPSLDLQSAFTLMAWVKLESVDPLYQAIISKHWSPTRPASLWVYRGGFVEVWFSPTGFAATSSATIAAGAWHHIAATFDNAANEIRIYIDGVLTDTVTGVTATPATNDQPLNIGQRGDNLHFAAGAFDGVMVWNRVLTALEIDQIYDYGP